MLRPNLSIRTTEEIAKAPIAPEIQPRRAPREKDAVLFSSPALSASSALNDTANEASPKPSTTAVSRISARLFVSAKPRRLMPAQRLPRISIFLLPYLSARIPSGMHVTATVTPMVVIVTPVQNGRSP